MASFVCESPACGGDVGTCLHQFFCQNTGRLPSKLIVSTQLPISGGAKSPDAVIGELLTGKESEVTVTISTPWPLVLVAEDTIDLAKHLVLFLEIGGCEVVLAKTPSSAFEVFESKAFDFVLCDGSGWELFYMKVFEKAGKEKCLVYSGDSSTVDKLRVKGFPAFAKGAADDEFVRSPGGITDYILTMLRDKGFSCVPHEEIY